MYVIGGSMNRDYNCASQMYRLDMQSLNWDTVGARGAEVTPKIIDEHTCSQMGNKVVIFGGFDDGERVNHVHLFDADTYAWKLLEPADLKKNKAPKPRAGHSATLHEGALYIFGGKDDENQKLEDLWRFDIESRVWTELIVENPELTPLARAGHTALIYRGYICIFGGIYEVTKELNDLNLYDIANNKWICLFTEKVEPVSAMSPTKAMAGGNASPLMRRN